MEWDIPICIKYMLVFSWVINSEVNWRSSNSKDSWGHWQHVWLIMAHESTLTLVIAGYWWVGSLRESGFLSFFPPLYRQDYMGVFFFFWQAILLSPFSLSLTFQSILLFFISPSSVVGFFCVCGETVWWGVFQHFINPCLCCLICYPFRFMVFPLSMWAD